MAPEPDEDRIRRKAHDLWVAEGQPHGRDQDHWDQAKEMVAIEDSYASALLPRTTGAYEPIEPTQALENMGDLPNLTDQGEHPLTDTSREPDALSPKAFINATGDTAGGVVRPAEEQTPYIDDVETVSRLATPELITGKTAAIVTVPAAKPRSAGGEAVSKTPETAPSGTKKSGPAGRAAPKKGR